MKPFRVFFFVIPRVGHGKHVLNTLSGSDRRNLVRKIKKGVVLTEEIFEGVLNRTSSLMLLSDCNDFPIKVFFLRYL